MSEKSERRVASHAVQPRGAKGKTPERPSHGAELRAMAGTWGELWKDVVRERNIGQDVLAGVTVAAVALPLNLALAVASGLPPGAGIVAGAVGGGFAAALGGSPLQVTGPAAALSVMVLALAKQFGTVGVAAACVITGIVLVALGLVRAGRFVRLLPEAVIAGFTTGVGLKLLDIQIPELFGFNYKVFELAQMMHRPHWLHEVSWLSVTCGLFVAFLVVTLKPFPRIPAALLGIAAVTFVANFLGWKIERVGEIPSSLPPIGFPIVPDERWLDLIVATLPLAVLCGAESLISAAAVDRMTPKLRKHDPNVELIGQGVANFATGLVQGLPVTGVVVRSGVNVQSGAKSRLSACVHAAGLLLAILYASELIAKIPLAGLAGLLCVVGVRLIEVKTFLHLFREERLKSVAFAATAFGTMTGHLVAALGVGVAICLVDDFLFHRPQATSGKITLARRDPSDARVRGVLGVEHAGARRPVHDGPLSEMHRWLSHIRHKAHVAPSAFVHSQASVIGRVVLGDNVNVAPGSSVRADEGSPFFIGPNSNVQDGVIIHALKERHVRVAGEEWAVYVGRNVSMAHGAIVHGPCYVGDDTFIGFKAVVHDAIVGPRCFIGINSVVVGVEVPPGKFVPHGTIVDTAEKAERLPDVSEAHRHFNEDVVEVNRGLAAAYQLDDASGEGAAFAPDGPRSGSGRPRLGTVSLEPPRLTFADRF